MIGFIVLNSIAMAMPYRTQPDWWFDMLSVVEVVFTVIFGIECFLKVSGLGGFKIYLANPMNVFDFFLVVLSVGSAVVTVTGEPLPSHLLEYQPPLWQDCVE